MKTFKIFFYFLIVSILFSCSSDNNSNSEFAIGKWKVTKRVVDGQAIELSECDLKVIYKFRDDFVLESYLDDNINIPTNVLCVIWVDFLYKWTIIEENKYGQTHACCPDEIITIYEKVGSKLIVNQGPNNWVEFKRI